MMSHNPYLNYYVSQAGSGIGNVYSGVSYQRGFGIGSFLGGLFRTAIPLLSRAGKYLGSELLKTTGHIVTDIAGNTPWRDSVRTRFADAGDNLTARLGEKVKTMVGSGYKRKGKRKRHQSLARLTAVTKRSRGVKRRAITLPRDIFT
jgi:hypothetical protein